MSSAKVRDAFRAFTTSCALITTTGTKGPNVMAAEWTFNVSYHPFLILVSIDPANLTHDMIRESKEFGVNLVAEDQIAAMAFAGHYSKVDTEKLSSELFETMPAKRIRAPMIRGALLTAECRLVQEIPLGDHTGFVGEVVEFAVDSERLPVVLHHGSRHLGERIARRPGITVAVTPMEAEPGSQVRAEGDLTGPKPSEGPVSVELRGADGAVLADSVTRSMADGSFRTTLRVPTTARAGAYRVVARSATAEAGARLLLR